MFDYNKVTRYRMQEFNLVTRYQIEDLDPTREGRGRRGHRLGNLALDWSRVAVIDHQLRSRCWTVDDKRSDPCTTRALVLFAVACGGSITTGRSRDRRVCQGYRASPWC